MTTLVATPSVATTEGYRHQRLVETLVVGGCLVAPVNLLIVRSLTVYDVLVFGALALLARHGQLRWPAPRYVAMFYVFVLATLLSVFRATYPSEALTQVLQYAFVFFVQIPVVLSVVRTRRLAVWSIVLLCVGSLGAILHAYLFQQTQGAGRVLVFYSDNPNRLGYPVVYLLPFLLMLWRLSRGQDRWVRTTVLAACAVSVALSAWALSASGSRSSLLGSVAALAVFVVYRPGLSLFHCLGRLLALTAVLGVLVVPLLASGQLPATLEERITRSLDAEDADAQTNMVADRKHLADAGLKAFFETPYLGTGLDNFRYVAMDYDVQATPQLPHNLWLQLLVQVGLFGTIGMALLMLFWAGEMVWSYRRVDREDQELLWGTAAALAGILTIFMFAPEMLDRHYWLVFALGLAIAMGAVGERDPGGIS